MVQFSYKIKDPAGIHPRPAGILINEAKKYDCSYTVSVGDKSCDMLKLLPLVGLGARKDDVITIKVSGKDEDAASDALMKHLEENL
jgi:phosphocarrier protein